MSGAGRAAHVRAARPPGRGAERRAGHRAVFASGCAGAPSRPPPPGLAGNPMWWVGLIPSPLTSSWWGEGGGHPFPPTRPSRTALPRPLAWPTKRSFWISRVSRAKTPAKKASVQFQQQGLVLFCKTHHKKKFRILSTDRVERDRSNIGVALDSGNMSIACDHQSTQRAVAVDWPNCLLPK